MEETAKLFAQMNHYNLLTVVHLPYLMHGPGAQATPRRTGPSALPPDYTYSRLTALTASRELLSRFIVFRNLNHVSSCCRSAEFKAFTASVALLLAHLDGHRLGRANILAHQRLQDLGMVDNAVRSMEDLSRLGDDVLSKPTAQVLRKLMEIEADASEGASYFLQSEDGATAEGDCRMIDENHVLKFSVPYFGTISIARQETKGPQLLIVDPDSSQTAELA